MELDCTWFYLTSNVIKGLNKLSPFVMQFITVNYVKHKLNDHLQLNFQQGSMTHRLVHCLTAYCDLLCWVFTAFASDSIHSRTRLRTHLLLCSLGAWNPCGQCICNSMYFCIFSLTYLFFPLSIFCTSFVSLLIFSYLPGSSHLSI